MTTNDPYAWLISGALVAAYALNPSPGMLALMMVAVAYTSFYAIPNATVAMLIVGVSLAAGVVASCSPISCALTAAQLGALAFLVAWLLRKTGLSPQAAMLLAIASVVLIVLACVYYIRGR